MVTLRPRALCALVLALGAAHGAHAHAFLERAQPRVGARLAAAPTEVRMWFSEELVGAFCRASLEGPSGKPLAEPAARVDGPDRRQLVLPLAGRLANGPYRVRWRAASVDSHVTQGDFTFVVGP
jgi:methionine-rich copper-binding protein CopC